MADDHITTEPSPSTASTEPADQIQSDGTPAPAVTSPGSENEMAPERNRHASADGAATVEAPAGLPAKAAPAPATGKAPPASSESKGFREVAETVVFVVVLVLLLKTFIAEAFVIPTGSMATTLWGYQRQVVCPNCDYQFPVNSSEVDPQSDRRGIQLERCQCPNCGYEIDFRQHGEPDWHSGDRVLVFKALYDTPLGSPKRHDVVVFKFPVEPQVNHSAMNYIKRLIGLPGETIAIFQGQLYVYSEPRTVKRPTHYWSESKPLGGSSFWSEDREAEELFQKGKFRIIRKDPDRILALRRIVHDNDYLPANTRVYPPRWVPEKKDTWKGNPAEAGVKPGTRFELAEATSSLSWLRYRHQLTDKGGPQLITDFLGYNSGNNSSGHGNGTHWVGDLILEMDVEIKQTEQDGELRLELAKGPDRFQARFDLQTGECSLVRLSHGGEKLLTMAGSQGTEEPARRPTALKKPGTYHLRFANVDERLTVWVNDDLPFGDGVAYAPALDRPTENDLQPAALAARQATLGVRHLQLWRDTYYTTASPGQDVQLSADTWSNPERWNDTFWTPRPMFMYVYPAKQPGEDDDPTRQNHYLCLGDNSTQSSDGRSWGLVPESLMLGRALLVYFPPYFNSWPLYSPTNRVGPIR